MKVYEAVAAAVLRVGVEGLQGLSWTELGEAFGVTKDQARHQLNRFKEKYNVVDSDIVPGWNRQFLKENTPESEKPELNGAKIVPGDVTRVYGKTPAVHTNPKGNTIFRDAEGKIQRGFVPNPEWSGQPQTNYGYGVHLSEETEYAGEVKTDTALKFETEVPAAPAPEQQIEPLKFLMTPAVLVVVRDEQPLTIDKSHKNFEKIKAALEAQEWQRVLDLIDMKNTLTKYSNGRVHVENGRVTLDGEPVAGKLVGRLINLLTEENQEALASLTAFLDKADENPDHRVVTRIYDFMAHNDLRTDAEGYILAYKVVKHDYKDKYSGTMDNSPGQVVKMKRNKVNPKDEETCSFGLHVAAKKYIPQYGSPSLHLGGDRVVLCRVHPRDFVSIPTDYNSMKARVCEYLVVKDVTELFCQGQLENEGTKA